jgi:hypothetical protein
MLRRLPFLLIGALVVALPACGGDDDKSTSFSVPQISVPTNITVPSIPTDLSVPTDLTVPSVPTDLSVPTDITVPSVSVPTDISVPTSAAGGDKDSYIAQADAICQAGDTAISTASATAPKNPDGSVNTDDPTFQTIVTSAVVPALEGELTALRALPAPAGDEETVAGIYDQLAAGIEKVKADPGALTDDATFAEANAAASAYGFKVCGA